MKKLLALLLAAVLAMSLLAACNSTTGGNETEATKADSTETKADNAETKADSAETEATSTGDPFADLPAEINAFSENDMSPFLEKYKDVVDVDILDMKMDSYTADKKLQTAAVSARLSLMEHDGRRIRKRTENLKLTMTKDAGCRTQAVCGASVLKCRGCGASLSLMEGKTCGHCGRNLDLKQFDWVIADYRIV